MPAVVLIYIACFNVYYPQSKPVRWVLQLISSNRWSNLSKITQPVSSQARTRIQALWAQSPHPWPLGYPFSEVRSERWDHLNYSLTMCLSEITSVFIIITHTVPGTWWGLNKYLLKTWMVAPSRALTSLLWKMVLGGSSKAPPPASVMDRTLPRHSRALRSFLRLW